MIYPAEAPRDCTRCPRLVTYREQVRARKPNWFNGAVPSFGEENAQLLIVGLAPGVTGANRTGRPFTGDFAGDLLYATLAKFGFSTGQFAANPNDGLQLTNSLITNAVRCVPPQNKPLPIEIATCRPYLTARIQALPNLKAILCLGRIAHESLLRSVNAKLNTHPFAHQARHEINGYTIFDSYHCSRYNTNTRRLTTEMFEAVFADVHAFLST